MNSESVSKLARFYQRRAAAFLFRNPLRIQPELPLVSFTFDDFPRSALTVGGAILREFGLHGTYYASLGLAGQDTPTGRIFAANDLHALLRAGHELGCHTFGHQHSWQTPGTIFEASILENRMALQRLAPGATFSSFSYPICAPRPFTKARVARHFPCCRSGGQAHNAGTADLNQLKAFFLEKSRDRFSEVQGVIDRNALDRGWLILATHDVSESPTPFGCSPLFFREVVRQVIACGAVVLPVAAALDVLRRPPSVTRFNRGAST